MMKKSINILSIIVLLVTIVAIPQNVQAKTISEFEAEVAKYTRELQEKKDAVAKNDAEVEEIRKKIVSIEGQIKEIKANIAALEQQIIDNNKEIEEKEEESKRIVQYYQLSNGENAYLEYAFGADSVTDMIYRFAVVEQLTEYNKQIMDRLTKLIEENEKAKADLSTKRGELETLQKQLESERARINADTAAIKHTMPGIEQQIKAAKANVDYYNKLGCGKNEDIQACQYRIAQANKPGSGGSVPSVNGWFRPMVNGYVTQAYKGLAHMGIDLSSTDKSEMIYPVASGQVFFNGKDSAGGLVVKIRHNVNGRYLYSTYAHMRSVVHSNLSIGSFISHTTEIGPMGSTGLSTGPHLHLEITTCDWNVGGGCTWAQYQQSTINPTSYITFPNSWNNR